MSRRQQDMRAEQELAVFLDRKMYPNIANSTWERVADKNLQLKGIDGFLITNGTEKVIDEKATLYYINRNLPTFAFEVNSFQHNHLTLGWLLSKTHRTTHYMLIYPNAHTNDLANIRSTDFTDTTCILIERQKIIDFLASKQLNEDRIKNDAAYLRAHNYYGKKTIPGVDDFYYYLSDPSKYSEAPLNIVIRRNVLERLAEQIIRC